MPDIISYEESLSLNNKVKSNVASITKLSQQSCNFSNDNLTTDISILNNIKLNDIIQSKNIINQSLNTLENIYKLLLQQQGLTKHINYQNFSKNDLKTFNSKFINISNQINLLISNINYNNVENSIFANDQSSNDNSYKKKNIINFIIPSLSALNLYRKINHNFNIINFRNFQISQIIIQNTLSLIKKIRASALVKYNRFDFLEATILSSINNMEYKDLIKKNNINKKNLLKNLLRKTEINISLKTKLQNISDRLLKLL